MPIRRRAFVGTVLLPLVAGCGSQSTPDPTEPKSTTDARTETERRTTEPNSGGTDTDRASGSVTVSNDATEDRFVTVVVARGDETVFIDSRTVRGGTSRRFDGVVPEAGDYRVVVDSSTGVRGSFGWQVTDAFGDLRVELSDEVTFSQVLRCDPDCPGVALGGTSSGYPDGGFDPRGRRAGSTLRVRNDGNEARTVRVRVADGTVLNYRYRVPPTTTLEIPVPQRSGETGVEVRRLDGAGSVRAYAWMMENSPTLRATVGADVRFTCGERTRELRLLNEDDTAHTLRVAVRSTTGEELFTETYDLAPDQTVREGEVVSTAGEYELTLATETSSVEYEWSTCPPRGPLYVIVQPDGTVATTAVAPI